MKQRQNKNNKPAWFLIFKSDFFTSTARFRNNRLKLPILLISIVVILSFLFRLAFSRFIQLTSVIIEPNIQIYSLIAVFSYIILFVPLVSPLGKVFFDTSGWKYQDSLASTPVYERDMLIGAFLSNLIFFLPFYGLLGTIMFAFFIGNAWAPWYVVSILLLIVLSGIITLGLLVGTIITPLVYTMIAKQRNDIARAAITFALSLLMLGGIFLALIYSNISTPEQLRWAAFLPSSLAANIIIFVLYGYTYSPGIIASSSILIVILVVFIILGWNYSDKLYALDEVLEQSKKEIKQRKSEQLLYLSLRKVVGVGIAEATLTNLKLTVRDIESLARLCLGISITVFLVYSLMGQLEELAIDQMWGEMNIQNAIMFISLAIGAGSMVYTEAANFMVSHKELFVLYKSSPKGASTFLIGKWIQMVLVQWFMAIVSIVFLQLLGIGNILHLLQMLGILAFNLFCMSGLVIGIYAINPTDNEEDVINMINMLFFFSIVLLFAGFTSSQFFFEGIRGWKIILPYIFEALFSICVFVLGILALEQMDIETLDSPLRRSILVIISSTIVWLISWIIFPAIILSFAILLYKPIIGYLGALIIPITIPLLSHKRKQIFGSLKLGKKKILRATVFLVGGLLVIFLVNMFVGVMIQMNLIKAPSNSIQDISALLPSFGQSHSLILIILISILVIIEELFFRGYLLVKLQKSLSDWVVIAITSTLFALLHVQGLATLIVSLIAGIVLAYARIKTETLIVPIGIHYIYNITLFLLLLRNTL